MNTNTPDELRRLAKSADIGPATAQQLNAIADGVDNKSGIDQCMQRADELRKADSTLTPLEAMRRAMNEPDIASLYRQEYAFGRTT